MNYKIKNYVDKLFIDKPNEPSVNDTKEELLANLNDKFNDLISDGKNPEEAYLLVISGIGEIEELLKPLQTRQEDDIPLAKANEDGDSLKDVNSQSKKVDETKKKTKYEIKKIIPLIWISVVVVFVLISFPTDGWDLAWTLFPFGGFLTLLTFYLLTEPKKKSYFYGTYWAGVLTFYLFINMFFEKVLWVNIWSWTWLIFPIAGVTNYIIHLTIDKDTKN